MAKILELLGQIETASGKRYWLAVLVKRHEVSEAEAGAVTAALHI